MWAVTITHEYKDNTPPPLFMTFATNADFFKIRDEALRTLGDSLCQEQRDYRTPRIISETIKYVPLCK